MQLIVKEYRKHNPRSRAVGLTKVYGSSGVVRRVSCTFCDTCIATSSQDWPETKQSIVARNTHWRMCSKALVYSLLAIETALRQEYPLAHVWDAQYDFDTFDQKSLGDGSWIVDSKAYGFTAFCGEKMYDPWEVDAQTCESCLLMRLYKMAA